MLMKLDIIRFVNVNFLQMLLFVIILIDYWLDITIKLREDLLKFGEKYYSLPVGDIFSGIIILEEKRIKF
jgi:hypothetical protein